MNTHESQRQGEEDCGTLTFRPFINSLLIYSVDILFIFCSNARKDKNAKLIVNVGVESHRSPLMRGSWIAEYDSVNVKFVRLAYFLARKQIYLQDEGVLSDVIPLERIFGS